MGWGAVVLVVGLRWAPWGCAWGVLPVVVEIVGLRWAPWGFAAPDPTNQRKCTQDTWISSWFPSGCRNRWFVKLVLGFCDAGPHKPTKMYMRRPETWCPAPCALTPWPISDQKHPHLPHWKRINPKFIWLVLVGNVCHVCAARSGLRPDWFPKGHVKTWPRPTVLTTPVRSLTRIRG